MLVEFIDSRGKTVFLNPMHVKLVREKKPGLTEVFMSPITFGASPSAKLNMAAGEVVKKLNDGMPDLAQILTPLDDAVQSTSAQTGGAYGAM